MVERDTVEPVEGAAAERVTVQVVDELEVKLNVAQWRDGVTVGVREKDAVAVVAFSDPVRVTVCALANVPVVAVKVVEDEPTGIVTEVGTARAVDPPVERVTTVPARAGCSVVTVHVDEAFCERAAGEQPNDVRTIRTIVRLTEALPPLSEAVTVAATWATEEVPAAALNCAVDEPAGTVTVPGIFSSVDATFSESETVFPPASAALRKVTVQVVEVFKPSDVARHCREVTLFGARREMLAGLEELFSEAVTVAV